MRWPRPVCLIPLLLLSLTAALGASGPDLSKLEATFARLARASRGTVGAALIHVESGAWFGVRGDERFPMASVYKLQIALELLTQTAQGTLSLDRQVTLAANDVRACCAISRRHPDGNVTFTLRELLQLMIVDSDNTASDAVLKIVGGPEAVQRRLSLLRFPEMRIDRYEGDINFAMTGVENPPPQNQWTLDLQHQLIALVPRAAMSEARARYLADPRDSSTPNEMARFLARLQLGDLLPPAQTSLLLNLMAHATTGPARIRRLLPEGTIVAHKTGTTEVVINDVGLITLPDDSPIRGHVALAVFVTDGRIATMQRTIAELAGATFEFFTGKPLPKPKPVKRAPPVRRRRR